ncbi:MAG: RICIN domain-containing protein [Sporichthyaceae bacterium]
MGIVARAFPSRLHAATLGLALIAAPIVALTTTAKAAAPPELTQTVTHQGKSVTVRLNPVSVRGPAFEVLLQKDDGSYAKQAAPAERAFLGSVDGDSAGYASAIRTSTGKLSGQIVFDRGATWFFTDGAVTGTRGLTPPAEYRWPSASKAERNVTVMPGQIGGTTMRWDQAFDIDTSWYTSAGKSSVAVTLDAVEQATVDMLATYTSNALLRPALGRIVIRGSAQRTPYAAEGMLDAVRTEWNTNHADADRDAVALVHGRSGGGVAWTGTMGSPTSAQSVNGGTGGFPTIVLRHEIGHNWGPSDNHTNGPEGATIESGNQYARFDGTELSAMMRLRDARLDKFPADAAAYPVALPPYAALDLADGAFSGVPLAMRPTANDADANRNALTLKSVDATSKLGGRITRSGNDVTYVPPAVGAAQSVDWFHYVVTDSTGKTATGVVIARVSPKSVLPPVTQWKPADVVTGVPYALVNGPSGLRAGTPTGASSGASLVQRGGTGPGTRFTVTTRGAGYRLRNIATGRCAEVVGGSLRNGARVIDVRCRTRAHQQWKVLEHPDGGLAIVGAASGKCVQPAGGALGAGAKLVQRSCSHSAAQRWALRAKPPAVDTWAAAPITSGSTYTVTNVASGLRAAGVDPTDSMPDLRMRAGDDDASRWVITSAPGGGHTLRVASTSRACLQVHYGSAAEGMDVTSWYCGDESDRRWRIAANPAGGRSLINVNSGLCVVPESSASGAILVQKTCRVTPEFRWRLTKHSAAASAVRA